MGNVYFFRDAPQFVREALADELSAAGHRIVDSNENFLVTGELRKFWVHTETTALYWNITAEIQLKLAVQKRDAPAFTNVEVVAFGPRADIYERAAVELSKSLRKPEAD